MVSSSGTSPYVLGIDLGVSSLGWACVALAGDTPTGLLDGGVRIFEAGVEGDIESGRDSSRAAARRGKRQPRRQIERRARRQRKIFRLLQRHGLLPQGPSVHQHQIDAHLAALDVTIRQKLIPTGDRIAAHVWPYRLRAAALQERLEPHELGRAFYHLAQRRGFLSNRKTDKDEKEAGAVKEGIAELDRQMRQTGAPTLGKYFATLDPEAIRIRQRWTARDMYRREFEAIFAAQAPHHSSLLTPRLRRLLESAFFRQRPLKSAKGLIGRCELEPTRRRAPLACLPAQRFRLLAAVNNLIVFQPNGSKRPLEKEERLKLIARLEEEGDLTFDAARKLLVLSKAQNRKDKASGNVTQTPGYSFNLEEGGEKKIPGNRSAAKLRAIFGPRWEELSDRQRDQLILDLTEYQHPSALAQRLERLLGVPPAMAAALSEVRLEQGYARFSRRALQRLTPRMDEGLPYMTARKDEYPGSLQAQTVLEALPPVLLALKDLRNPAVCRALTELRKVVNAILRKHGKPSIIRLELARDLKQPRKSREATWKRNREREDQRTIATDKIKAARVVVGDPNRDAIEKWLLADECNWLCPYTGKTITIQSLLGPHPQFDVEHIVPFSISLDNTFINKTLCDVEFNRHHKQNRLPAQCYDLTASPWQEALLRVRRFRGNAMLPKLERFQWTSVTDDFTNRHLQDTRYASRLAGDYLGLLFGGAVDEVGRRRVQVSAGGATAFLRDEWAMNGILNDGGIKTRDDHRHHMVDAVAIALTSPSSVKLLAEAAGGAARAGRRRFAQIPEPWSGFLDEVRVLAAGARVSHRCDHRLNGPLHNETNYSRAHQFPEKGKSVEVRHVRKPLVKMSAGEVEDIVDARVKQLVLEKLQAAGGPPSKAFVDPTNLPALSTRDGRSVPIKSARIRVRLKVRALGAQSSARYVGPGPNSNHHLAVVARLDPANYEVGWDCELICRLDAVQRLAQGQTVVQRDWGPGRAFKFTLTGGDCLELLGDDGKRQLLRVANISAKEIELRPLNDARPATIIRKIPGSRIRVNGQSLFKLEARKVALGPLGEVWPCND